jgi:nucleotide-binding universal stress UspA family protein
MATIVLVAVDFEEASRRAIEVARTLAAPLGAELCLLHVYRLPIYTYPGFEPQSLPALIREISTAAAGALAQLAAAVSVTRTLLREGEPAAEILAAAREEHALLIAMGTHGRRGLAHALLGSVAERVVRDSDVPVLTVRADDPHRSDPHRSGKSKP